MPQLTIFHTNDLHGRIHQVSRIGSIVRKAKLESSAAGGNCLYLDGGDSEDTVLLESSLTKGSAVEAVMRSAGCDYIALGNAIPLRYGTEPVKGLALAFGKPLLCANLLDQNNRLIDGLATHIVIEIENSKIAIIGLTAPLGFYSSIFKLNVLEPEVVVDKLVPELRSKGIKTILVLSHIGSSADRKLARSVKGIDLIIGGHDHKILHPPEVEDGTLIAQTGEYGKYLGRLDLDINQETGKISSINSALIPINDEIPEDLNVLEEITTQHELVRKMMEVEVGYLDKPLTLSTREECSAGNLLADALLERVPGAEIAISLAGKWNEGLPAGMLSQGTLYQAIRSAANPARAILKGAQLEVFFKEAMKPENACRQMHFLRGGEVGLPHIAGATLIYYSKTGQVKVKITELPLDPTRSYVVAATDMEFSNLVNYLEIPDEELEYEVPIIMPEVLEEYIKLHTPVTVPKIGRLTIR